MKIENAKFSVLDIMLTVRILLTINKNIKKKKTIINKNFDDIQIPIIIDDNH